MMDLLPKDNDGKPLGKLVEIEYDVVDLPTWDFDRLVGGTVLRLALGILKKMIEGDEDEFPEALLPLRDISDEEQQVELTKELLNFVAKAMAAHNRRLDETLLSRALKPIFKDKGQVMIKTIFDEKYEQGVAEGEARGIEKGIETLLHILTKRLGDVPPNVCDKLHAIHDLDVLGQLTDVALDCKIFAEFKQALNK